MTVPLRTRLVHDRWVRWIVEWGLNGTKIVRDTRNDKVYEVLVTEWNGETGVLTCKPFLSDCHLPTQQFRIEFNNLEHLNEMEVLASMRD